MADETTPKIQNWTVRWMGHVKMIMESVAQLLEQQKEALVLDYATELTDEMMEGTLNHLSWAKVVASFEAVTALEELLVADDNQHYIGLLDIIP